jgi:hypothetical protein
MTQECELEQHEEEQECEIEQLEEVAPVDSRVAGGSALETTMTSKK